jgi:hypothetical protein
MRSMVPMSGKSTYRHAAMSMTSSTDATPAVEEGSGAVDITTSRSPAGGGGAESSSEGTITMSASPEPAPVGGSDAAWGGGRPHGHPSLFNGGGGHWRGRRARLHHGLWRGRRARLLQRGGHGQPLLNLRWKRLGAQGLGTRLGRHDPRTLGQAFQGREAEHADVGIPTRRQS